VESDDKKILFWEWGVKEEFGGICPLKCPLFNQELMTGL
jgi:hypothetical protein